MNKEQIYLKKIGKKIKKERMKNNLTLAECAKQIGKSETFLCKIENGEKDYSLKMLEKICKILNVEIIDIL